MKKFIIIVLFAFLLIAFLKSLSGNENKLDNKQIAVIKIQGPIYSTTVDSLTGSTSGADEIMQQIISARDDKSVAAVLLRIDSPGGSVTAAEEISTELKKLKATGKPVIASMGDMAASAGYWLATDTDYIFANPSTLTGSIGVYVPYMNVEELYKKIGISQDKIKSGQYKDIMSPDRPMTPQERQIMQTMVNQMYDSFVAQVSNGRKMPEDTVRRLADGRIYTGLQAKELLLVDQMGNYYDALAETAKRAGIQGEPKVKEYKKTVLWKSLLSASLQTHYETIVGTLLEKITVKKGVY